MRQSVINHGLVQGRVKQNMLTGNGDPKDLGSTGIVAHRPRVCRVVWGMLFAISSKTLHR